MHDGTIQQGDTWLQNNINAYAQWAKTHNSLLIVTWDEDDGSQNNQVATIFYGQMVQPGQYGEQINHFNVLRTIEDMYGVTPSGQSANVSPITDIWTTQTQAAVTHFGVTAPAGVTAGSAFNLTVSALDANNNVVTGYRKNSWPTPAAVPSTTARRACRSSGTAEAAGASSAPAGAPRGSRNDDPAAFGSCAMRHLRTREPRAEACPGWGKGAIRSPGQARGVNNRSPG
jgi:hypothetical protein